MYKVLFLPNYDESIKLADAYSAKEAMKVIFEYCSIHNYTPTISHWHKLDAPNQEIIDVGTGHDYFLIINEDGGRVNIE